LIILILIYRKLFSGCENILIDSKKQLVEIGNQIYHNGLTPGKSGNISIKIPCNNYYKIVISPSGVSLKNINLKNVIVIDNEGNKLEGQGKPSSEMNMHLEIYKKRKEVSGIVHTHSPYATGFSFSGEKIPHLEGFGKIIKPYLNEVDYATPGSSKLAKIASNGLKKEDMLILKNHGVIAIGTTIDEATLLAEFVENSAKISFITRNLIHEPIPTHLKHSR
jgi:L-fuculose-phosphate aldolase